MHNSISHYQHCTSCESIYSTQEDKDKLLGYLAALRIVGLIPIVHPAHAELHYTYNEALQYNVIVLQLISIYYDLHRMC